MGMPNARPVLPKEKEIYELNNDEKFSYVRTAKIGKLAMYCHFLIVVMKCGRSSLKVVNFMICRFGHKPYGFQETTAVKRYIG
jgi:hypothetical protein